MRAGNSAVRVPSSHGGSRRFESSSAHQKILVTEPIRKDRLFFFGVTSVYQQLTLFGGTVVVQGDREGQYSIRINDQWRVCFLWEDGNAHQVEIVDYH